MKNITCLITLTSFLFSTITFAMEDEKFDHLEFSQNPSAFKVRFEKREELNEMILQYKMNGKPISLAVACGAKEMPRKIIDLFNSLKPANEQWVGLDLYLTDEDEYRSGPHIRMDATNKAHWEQVIQYLKDNEVEVDTVAFTAFAPSVNSALLREIIMPIVKKGGRLVYPAYFAIKVRQNESADCMYFGPQLLILNGRDLRGPKYLDEFKSSLKGYYMDQNSGYFKDTQALEASIMAWDGMEEFTEDAERRLAVKVFANRVTSFNSIYVDKVLKRQLLPVNVDELFLKNPDEFSRDYIAFFRQYMTEIGFDPTSYKIYSKPTHDSEEQENINLAELYEVEEYIYPQDGTFDLAGYGNPSLVLINNKRKAPSHKKRRSDS